MCSFFTHRERSLKEKVIIGDIEWVGKLMWKLKEIFKFSKISGFLDQRCPV